MSKQPIFITGIGTGIGKTLVSAIITEAIEADYWKPIQAGFEESTDALTVQNLISNAVSTIHPELYKLQLAASPHLAAAEESIEIKLDAIAQQVPIGHRPLIIEGAGGIMVPLNNSEFVIDLILKLKAKLIIVSRNYLGSINHSLLTAEICKQRNLDVLGWVFNDQYLNYQQEIVQWSGFPCLGTIPYAPTFDKAFVQQQAITFRSSFQSLI